MISKVIPEGVAARRRHDSSGDGAAAFTLKELLAVIAVVGVLAVLVLPALGNAKGTARQLSCLNNLRQLGVASRMYVVEFQQYTGSLSINPSFYYVWPDRLLRYTQMNRKLFGCPGAISSSSWDTNLNTTLGGTAPFDTSDGVKAGAFDRFGVTSTTRFSYGFNDWGLNMSSSLQLGLGGDVDGYGNRGPVRDGDVVAPDQMIMLADVPAYASAAAANFNANLDPNDDTANHCQRPSNRHHYLTDILFTDGHTETPRRNDVISPALTNPWRNRWNNDNQPHNEYVWTVNPTYSNPLDP